MARQRRTGSSESAEKRLGVLAARQCGVVSRRQLRGLGFGDDAIDRAIAVGRLHPVFRGVFAVGHPQIGRQGRLMAAVLVCGPVTVVSHRSAAALLGLIDRGPVVIDVTAPGKHGRKIDGIKAHKGPPPLDAERCSVAGIPCTSPARTVVDIAGTSEERTLRGAFETAAYKRVLDLDAIETALAGRRVVGAPLLRRLVAEWRVAAERLPAQPKLRSPLEARVLPLLAQTDLPVPRVNAPVATPGGVLEVDLLWPDQGLAVELDSRRHHGTDLAFERDRKRDRELMRAGYATLRPTWHHVEHEPEAVVAAIAEHLTR